MNGACGTFTHRVSKFAHAFTISSTIAGPETNFLLRHLFCPVSHMIRMSDR